MGRKIKTRSLARPEGAKCPPGSRHAFLQARTESIEVNNQVGVSKIVTETTAKSKAGGYWCEVCERQFMDSASYLTHMQQYSTSKSYGFQHACRESLIGSSKG